MTRSTLRPTSALRFASLLVGLATAGACTIDGSAWHVDGDAGAQKTSEDIRSECGDGRLDGFGFDPEVCDGTLLNDQTCASFGYDGGTLGCAPGCREFDVSMCTGDGVCGNGFLDGDEACDDGLEPTDTCGVYDESCTVCTTECTEAPGRVRECGDGISDRPNEVCDGPEAGLGAETCEGLGWLDGGTLGCEDDCQAYDTSACLGTQCGNDTVEGDEECDWLGEPPVECEYGETECDACTWECTIVPGITSYCGDGRRNYVEDCDGNDHGRFTCGGAPAVCGDDCTWDVAPCDDLDVGFDVDWDADDTGGPIDVGGPDGSDDVSDDVPDVPPDSSADVSNDVQADTASPDSGTAPVPTTDEDQGCSASGGSGGAAGAWWMLVAAAAGAWRRRR